MYHKILRTIKRGELLQVSLTMDCNLNCKYCSQTSILGNRPPVKETNFIGWVKFFERWPYRLKEVYVSGGEPTLHPDFTRIVKYLLGKGYYVKVFSNLLSIDKLMEIPSCYRFRVQATYHHKYDPMRFDLNYQILHKKHIVYVNEIEGPKVFKYTKLQKLLTNGHTYADGYNNYETSCLRISPDLHINLNCRELISHI